MQGRFALVAATVAIAAIVSEPASGAVAKSGGFHYVTKQYEVAGTEAETFKAPCPPGTHVYSGGYYNTGPYDSGYVVHSFPYDGGDRKRRPDDGWKARVDSRNPPTTWLVYATCAGPMPKYLHKLYSLTGEPTSHTVMDTCEPGLNVFGGGTRGDDLEVEVQSHPAVNPTQRQWIVKLDSFTADPTELDLYVVCADLTAGYLNSPDTVAPHTQEGHSTGCPAELKHVVGGGVSHNGLLGDVVIAASRPTGFPGPAVDGWQAYLDNYDGDTTNNAVSFNAYAVCSERVN